MPSEKGELDASVVMALSLLWYGILASSTHFCITLSRSWTRTNSSILLQGWSWWSLVWGWDKLDQPLDHSKGVGGGRSVIPLALRVYAALGLHSSRLSGNGGGPWIFWRAVISARDWSFRRFNSSHSRAVLSRSCTTCSRLQSNRACCFAISSISINIWRSLYVDGRWASLAVPVKMQRWLFHKAKVEVVRGDDAPSRARICLWIWYRRWWSPPFVTPDTRCTCLSIVLDMAYKFYLTFLIVRLNWFQSQISFFIILDFSEFF